MQEQNNKTYFYCSKCGINGWYNTQQENCTVHIDAVECECGEWV